MTAKALRKYWLIQGHATAGLIFQRAFPISRYSDAKMALLLQTLAAKANLNFDEICFAMGPKRRRTVLLDVHQQFSPFALMCGDNPTFTARVFAADDRRLAGLIEDDPPYWRR